MDLNDDFFSVLKLRKLYKALLKCIQGNMWKPSTVNYWIDRLENSILLKQDVVKGIYMMLGYKRFKITSPKPRDIVATKIRDRHLQRSACDNLFYHVMTKSFIRNNGACQKGRGTSDALNRLRLGMFKVYQRRKEKIAKFVGCNSSQVGPFSLDEWAYVGDVEKYFPSTRYSVAKKVIKRRVRDEKCSALFCGVVESFGAEYWVDSLSKYGLSFWVVNSISSSIVAFRVEREFRSLRFDDSSIFDKKKKMIEKIEKLSIDVEAKREIVHNALYGDPRSIGLGSQASQIIQLAQLDEIDHYVQDQSGVDFYIRYMDDFIIMDNDINKLRRVVTGVQSMLGDLKLDINKKSHFDHISKGFVFLQWNVRMTDTGKVLFLVKKKTIKNEKRKLKRIVKKVKEKGSDIETVYKHFEGWKAHLGYGNTHCVIQEMNEYFNKILSEVYYEK